MTILAMGQGLVIAALALTVAAIGAGLARRWRLASGVLVGAWWLAVLAIGLLEVALLRGDFRLDYVVRQTSHALPTAYKFAALWAGQEGTILLWSWMLLGLGWGLLRGGDSTRRGAALTVLSLAGGLLALLLLRSPFAATPEPVQDGHGLNPLLQNPWMMIHPPVLFLGYAVLTVPFALALAALWRGEPQAWLESGRRYLLAGWTLLGLGQMLGGYWAYITLGWGGFWAWDPVENASLVPWITASAALHSLRLQRRQQAGVALNYLLALATLVLVMYGSYLTRSGALDGFSVHSFESLGAGYNLGWLALMLVPLVVGLTMLVRRRSVLGSRALTSDNSWLLQGVWVLAVMAAAVWVGMSWPLLTRPFTEKGIAVEQSFYNRTQTVLWLFAALTLVCHALARRHLGAGLVVVGGVAGLALVGATTTPAHPLQVRLGLLLAGGGSGAMVAVGLYRAVTGWRHGAWARAGAGLAHAGMALLVIGALVSGPGERSERVELALGAGAKTQFGEVTFRNAEETKDGKLRLELALGAQSGHAVMFESDRGQMRNPVLFHRVWGDIYLEPEEIRTNQLKLAKGQSGEAAGLKITFEGFDMGGAHGMEDGFKVGAKLKVDRGKGAEALTPVMKVSPNGPPEAAPAQLGEWTVALEGVEPESHSVMLSVKRQETGKGQPSRPVLLLRVTRKPAIGLVWLGTLVLLAGGLLALRRTRRAGVEAAAA